jgi:uracil-DNA glycosylase
MHELPLVDYEYPVRPTPERLAIIGEAPGADEVKQGRPFVGRAGKFLDDALAAAGVDRRACLVGNVFRRRPPDNNVGHFFSSRRKAAQRGAALVESYGPLSGSDFLLADYAGEITHLRETLAAWGPAAILALGRTPLWALTGRTGITQCRGQRLPCSFLPGVAVVPACHPSYVTRDRVRQTPIFIHDIRLAQSLAGGHGGSAEAGREAADDLEPVLPGL